MARKKADTETESGAAIEESAQGVLPEGADGEDKQNAGETGEIPDEVKKILQRYPAEEILYVDRFGGVFTPGTKPDLAGNAILYKNPFYNKLN
jgi:hypothetical protein